MEIFLIYLLIGVIAGLLSGLLGVGGGIIVVPALAYAFQLLHFPDAYVMHLAVGTSLAVMVVTAFFSSISHYRRGNADLPLVLKLTLGMVMGVVIGALVSVHLHSKVLAIVLGVILLLISLRMLFFAKSKPKRQLPGLIFLFLMSIMIGFLSGLLGIGGATMLVPILVYCSVSMHRASGTAAVCTLPIAIAGTVCYLLLSAPHWQIHYTTGFVYWPALGGTAIGSMIFAFVGTWLGAKVNTVWLKRIFAVFLLAVAVQMLTSF